MNQNIGTLEPVDVQRLDLKAHFEMCQKWNDADQWDCLGVIYLGRGYLLNALYCFRRADALRGAE